MGLKINWKYDCFPNSWDFYFWNNSINITLKIKFKTSEFYFMKGRLAEGHGSPHTGKDRIWPMGIILRAMTSIDANEIKECLKMLKATHAGKGFIHESFNKDNPEQYSRDWFAWANTLFGELILKIYKEYREILMIED